ncbi:MAG: zinc-ribbon domain-containing protein [Candidatus Bathyarchaeia archaeon]|jgi:phosphoribosyl 1,2-cyclic phosphodiesterase
MPYCPKCGNQVEENMTFCPRCGAPLKMEAPRPTPPPPPPSYHKDEKSEKGEKQEKNEPEKGEKHEKGESGFVGWLIGGIIVIVIGLLAYLRAINFIPSNFEGPLILLVVGVAIIIVAVYMAMTARKRHPSPNVR